ncbi:hypothetical protein KZZ52_49925 [Dactylosporangium sp. AC04546]|uniref:hypothetical protein n=1 Tax=Dactylosporangium sp. AC04546 TaxID=2862460 RepID=UPI001EE10763|nr:hypothetical protein [Dactylosporangium sp. AC04546]WVK82004.1 hypothetical protein KZZ52_49925 [Dactylosporangium sp. AC04546]
MAIVARWWNGRFGRLARRDVWLFESAGRWTVEALEGGVEGRSASWEFNSEAAARTRVDELLVVGDGWRSMRVQRPPARLGD